MEKERFKNIDFLKFFGAICILYFHLNLCIFHFYQEDIPFFQKTVYDSTTGGLWVEMFFIISGFFLFKSKIKMKPITFFIKRYIRLYPTIIFATVVYCLLSKFNLLDYRPYENIFVVLSLNGLGVTSPNIGNIHPSWFVSVLLRGSLALIWLRELLCKQIFDYIVFITILSLSIYISNNPNDVWILISHCISFGLIRCFLGICIGYAILEIYEGCKKIGLLKSNNLYLTIIFSFLEVYLISFTTYNTLFHKMNFTQRYPVILLAISLLFITFIINKGIISKFLNNNFSKYLGQISYAILMTHIILFDFFSRNIFPKHFQYLLNNYYLIIFLLLILSIFLGILTFHIIEKPCQDYFNRKLKIFNQERGDANVEQ